MKNDCIICFKTYNVKTQDGRATCSEKCQKRWDDFMLKLKRATPQKREELIEDFLLRVSRRKELN